jgi:uncharacterized protein
VTPEDVVRLLDLKPHPEGGLFRETFRDSAEVNGRSRSTAIYYLLRAGEVSRWHRIDAVEIWHWYAGDALELESVEGARIRRTILGPDLAGGHAPQRTIPARCWQSARSLGAYTLVGCTVAPGFEYSGFELAPPGWEPG